MPRKKRALYPDHYYHIMLRGNGGQGIFLEDSDRAKLCLLMQYAIERHNFLIHAFCFMDNHIHLLVEAKNTDLSKGIHTFAFRYAQYFNQKYRRKGHLFQGRFKAVIIQRGTYFCRLIRYIHRNPVRAGMTELACDYAWSSHRAYISQEVYSWLTMDQLLSFFTKMAQETHSDVYDVMKKYIDMGDTEAKDHLAEIRRSTRLGIYGNEEFVRSHGDNVLNTFSTNSSTKERITLSNLIQTTCNLLKISQNELCGSSRKESLVIARGALALLASDSKVATISELASALSRDQSSLSRLKQKAVSNPYCLQIAAQVGKELFEHVPW